MVASLESLVVVLPYALSPRSLGHDPPVTLTMGTGGELRGATESVRRGRAVLAPVLVLPVVAVGGLATILASDAATDQGTTHAGASTTAFVASAASVAALLIAGAVAWL